MLVYHKGKLNIHQITAKFFLQLLIHEQKQVDVEISWDVLDCSNEDDKFLKNNITDDKTWVYEYDIKTKAHHEIITKAEKSWQVH